MAIVVSKVDKLLVISAKRLNKIRNTTEYNGKENGKDIVINFKAKEPIEIPDDIAEIYTKAYPHIYQFASADDENENKDDATSPEGMWISPEGMDDHIPSWESIPLEEDNHKGMDSHNEKNSTEFDPVDFLEENHSNIEEALLKLGRKELIKTAKVLGLSTGNLKNERLIDKIVQEIRIRDGQ